MNESMIHYELRLDSCIAEVWLNDIPLARIDGSKMAIHTRVAHGYLVPGINRIEIVAAPGATPSLARTGRSAAPLPSTARAAARIVRYKVGEMTGENAGETYVSCRLGSANPSPTVPGMPVIVAGQGEVRTPFAGWAWLGAPVLNFEKVQPEVVALVRRVHEDFSRGQPENIIALMEVCHAETAVCLPGWTAEELRSDLADMIRATPTSGAVMKPLVDENFDLRLCAGGRLIECIGKDWRPLIERGTDSSGESISFRMFVGKHKGKWAILRSSE